MKDSQTKPSVVPPSAAILSKLQDRFLHKSTLSFNVEVLKGFLFLDEEKVHQLLAGKLRLDRNLAEKLSSFFEGTSAQYWLQKQKKYVTATIRSALVDYLDAELVAAGNRIDELLPLSGSPYVDYSTELSQKMRLRESLTVVKSLITSYNGCKNLEEMIETRLSAIDAF